MINTLYKDYNLDYQVELSFKLNTWCQQIIMWRGNFSENKYFN